MILLSLTTGREPHDPANAVSALNRTDETVTDGCGSDTDESGLDRVAPQSRCGLQNQWPGFESLPPCSFVVSPAIGYRRRRGRAEKDCTARVQGSVVCLVT